MQAGQGTESVEALLGRLPGELREGQERADQLAEGGSAFVVHWRGPRHLPWGLQARTWEVHLGFDPESQMEYLKGPEEACWDPSFHELDCSLSPLVQALVLLVPLLARFQLQELSWAWAAAAACQAWAFSPGQPSGGGLAEAVPGPASYKP